MQGKDHRRHARLGVDLQGQIGVGQDRLFGSVLDLSDKGAFFQPERGFVDARYVYRDEPVQRLRTGDRVYFQVERDDATYDSPAVVRWVGGSNDHHSVGLGLRFIGGLKPRSPDDIV